METETIERPRAADRGDLALLAGWYGDAGEIIAHLGCPSLPAILDDTLRRLVSFDLSVIFAYPFEARPLHLHDGLRALARGAALDAYLDGAYLLDPFYVACARSVPAGLYRMRDLAPDAFFRGEYVGDWTVHPCISMDSGTLAEEIGYVMDLPNGVMATYSLMRSHDSPPFSQEEFDRLRHVEPIVRQAMRGHWRNLAAPAGPRGPPRPPAFKGQRGETLERAFARFGTGCLSTRERMVTQMILRGHSARSIAASLGIADGTVRNHRKSIYAKLGIASQQELFSLFLAHVLT